MLLDVWNIQPPAEDLSAHESEGEPEPTEDLDAPKASTGMMCCGLEMPFE